MKRKNFLVGNVIDSMNRSSKGTILRSMAIFTAVELCGSILNGKTGPRTTKKNFQDFCKSSYMPREYHDLGDLLYPIFRCGVAHSYVSKGAALLSSNYHDKSKHLQFYSNGLFIYVPKLEKDVRTAIKRFYDDIKKNVNSLQDNYRKVIQELDGDGKKEFNKYISSKNIPTKKRKIQRDIVTDII